MTVEVTIRRDGLSWWTTTVEGTRWSVKMGYLHVFDGDQETLAVAPGHWVTVSFKTIDDDE